MKSFISNLEVKAKRIYEWINNKSHGATRLLRIAIFRFGESNATHAAAGMAYYAFFSLFPLLLFLIVGGSYVLENQFVYEYIMENVFNVLPTARNVVDANIQQVLESRGAVGLLGIVGFIWSSSAFFSILAKNINMAHPDSSPRNFLEDRALALGMIALLATLLGLSILSNTITGVLPSLDLFFWHGKPMHETIVWRYIIKLIPFLLNALLFIGLYRFIPKKESNWYGVLIASALAAISWQLATRIFTWAISAGLVRFELVYGSLGVLVALMSWMYIISLITLFGAHLSAVIEMKVGNS